MAQVPEFSAFNFTSQQPRGLRNFIGEIRKCASKEQERTRVDAELGNIRLMRATLILLYLFLCRSRCIKSFGVFPRRCTSRST